MTNDAARRMLFGHYHGQPVTVEGQEEFQYFLMIMARKVLRGTDQENEDAISEFTVIALDRARHPTWLRLSEDALWKAMADEYYWKFLRVKRANQFAENHQVVCSAGQISRHYYERQEPEEDDDSFVKRDEVPMALEEEVEDAGHLRLPNVTDIAKARNLFLDALDSFNSTEWPEGDPRALVKHVLLFYDELDLREGGQIIQEDMDDGVLYYSPATPMSENKRRTLKRKWGLKQKEIGDLFGLKPDVASRLLAKAREERQPASGPGEPVNERFLLTVLQRLETIIKRSARYQS